MAEDNIFEIVRANGRRLDEIEHFVRGDPTWNQPGLLTLLRTMQERQEKHAWQISILVALVAILLLACLVILVVLVQVALHLGV